MGEMPSLLERTRMALAEVGFDPMAVEVLPNGQLGYVESDVDDLTAWRAASLAYSVEGVDQQHCYACHLTVSGSFVRQDILQMFNRCLADRPCVMDCAVER